MNVQDTRGRAAQIEVVQAVRDGRILHFNGAQASIVHGDGALLVDVVSGQGEYVSECSDLSRPPLPPDKAKAADLAQLWDLPWLKSYRTVADDVPLAASEVVSAFLDGRVLHFNGAQAAILSADGMFLVSADPTTGVTVYDDVDASASAQRYLDTYLRGGQSDPASRAAFVASRAGQADPSLAHELAELWNVTVVDESYMSEDAARTSRIVRTTTAKRDASRTPRSASRR